MNWFHWEFMEWFKRYATWDTIGWLTIIGIGAVWEVEGALFRNRTTFTDLVRHTTPVWLRLVVLCVLIYHFCVAKVNFTN